MADLSGVVVGGDDWRLDLVDGMGGMKKESLSDLSGVVVVVVVGGGDWRLDLVDGMEE
jgi:hypothetical protein